MALYIIPYTKGSYGIRQTVSLGGFEYSMAIKYNNRDGFFYLSIENKGILVKSSTRIVSGVDLLTIGPNASQPQGKIYVYDLDATDKTLGRDPTLETFGDRTLLVWDDGE